MHILYLAHDLDDTAIWRRAAMIRQGGASLRVAGFRRGTGSIVNSLDQGAADAAHVWGRTENGKLGKRVFTVLRAALSLVFGRQGTKSKTPDVILARNLEMLALAMLVRLRMRQVAVVYEVLDVHRIMLGTSAKSRLIRWVERGLMRNCSLVLVSSEAFVRNYLVPVQGLTVPWRLVENKPLEFALSALGPVRQRPVEAEALPLRIGWFGILRCKWSLGCLDQITRAQPGRFAVTLRGKPALDAIPDFHAVVEANPDLVFKGPYRWPGDLEQIYTEVDLAWLIDRYDAGANSDWLLPNRLYEGALYGAVPVALDASEIGRRLRDAAIGVLVPKAEAVDVSQTLAALEWQALAALRARQDAIPLSAWVADTAECVELVAALSARSGAATATATAERAKVPT